MLQSTHCGDFYRVCGDKMKVNDKIHFFRETRNWSQEEMADKLGMSVNGYSKIERGETRLTIPKLEKIVEVFDTDILELMSFGEKNVIFFQESENNNSINIINANSQDLVSEIAQLKQTIAHQAEIIEMQKSQMETLQSLVAMLKEKA